ncbi:MAG TPA: inositol-3-phosphate synthase [Pyrinomonadaceae bacterium]|nr:inositol-3-phosphate synthase [Chloracidobacterium sp.]HBE81842.1 inositol-3-phosphate synthase [Blastocatellia bacterium]HRJ87755.1 inositol-3-phosphate synthase [Pyrinomonadaceae bacterium]HRK50211.1 inositol-3-phosphate synthase [Pyrinomonadaceae bacterium]
MSKRKLGIAVVGIGGAVGTTMAAGIELLKKGLIGTNGLPLADRAIKGLVDYTDLAFAGWDLFPEDLAKAAESHEVLTYKQHVAVEDELRQIKPWHSVGDERFLSLIEGQNKIGTRGHRATIDKLRADLAGFKAKCDSVVVINLASTEKLAVEGNEIFNTLAGFENALDENADDISPAMLYAYAAIAEGVPYGNFTPSVSADTPALIEFARERNVPIAGKDGKTGQTFIKTVLAPALKSRSLHVDGWYSTNILGNRDGLALSNEDSLASKVKTKSSVLDDILGYEVEDHIVDIRYYRPRGDNKEAWDNIDISGFLGQSMQIKVNFLCKDSILAAPLAIEIARCLDLAQLRGEGGIQEQLSVFFKLPMINSTKPEHAFHKQEELLLSWLAS